MPVLDGLNHYLGIVPQDICEKTGLANVHWEDPSFIVAPTIDTDQSLGFWACETAEKDLTYYIYLRGHGKNYEKNIGNITQLALSRTNLSQL